jgi:hypothetical protein
MCEAVAREKYDHVDFETQVRVYPNREGIEMPQIPGVSSEID